MTVASPESQGGEVAIPADMTGLEDFDVTTDAVMPRISIVHKSQKFKDNLSGEEFPILRCVLLGLVKQRILWNTVIDDDDKPMCKSPDFDFGFPLLTGNNGKTFPVERSGFDLSQIPANTDGFVALPCANCALKEWGSHPDGKKPYCSEQHTFPLMYDPTGENEDVSQWMPGLLTIQKTGIKPSKNYITAFVRGQTPLYTAITEISLVGESRGTTDYSVPAFKRTGNVDQQLWPTMSQSYRSIREFVRAHPSKREEDAVPAAQNNEWSGAPAQAAPAQTQAPAAPVQTPEPAPVQAAPAAPVQQAAADDDLPF